MIISSLRKEFGNRFNEFNGKIEKLGTHPWNLLHNPNFETLLKEAETALNNLHGAGIRFHESLSRQANQIIDKKEKK